MYQPLRRICLFSNYNAYESKRHFTVKLIEAMHRQGIDTLHLDTEEIGLTPDKINKIIQYNPDLTCSFNTILPSSGAHQIGDFLQIPHWSILLDPAAYSLGLIESTFSLISCVDQADVNFFKAHPFENVFFFPHAVEKELIGTGHLDKIYDVVFIGSCYGYLELEALLRQKYPEKIQKIVLDASELVLSKPKLSADKALIAACEKSNVSQDEINFKDLFYFVDRHSRGKDRVELIKSIRNANVHVFGCSAEDEVVLGGDWKQYLADCKHVTFHPAVSFTKSLEILKQSKIVLNSSPFFKYGSHERIFTALACGAVPLTNVTPYWEEHFERDREITFYHPNARNQANEVIQKLLSNESLRSEIVERGAQKVLKHHTWDQLVESLKEILPPLLIGI